MLVAPGEVADLLAASPLAIDAILGTGCSRDAVKAPFDRWIRALNDARVRGTVVVAADVPSGLSAQTGAAAATAPLVPAPCCGRIRVAPLAYIEPLLEAAAG